MDFLVNKIKDKSMSDEEIRRVFRAASFRELRDVASKLQESKDLEEANMLLICKSEMLLRVAGTMVAYL